MCLLTFLISHELHTHRIPEIRVSRTPEKKIKTRRVMQSGCDLGRLYYHDFLDRVEIMYRGYTVVVACFYVAHVTCTKNNGEHIHKRAQTNFFPRRFPYGALSFNGGLIRNSGDCDIWGGVALGRPKYTMAFGRKNRYTLNQDFLCNLPELAF